MVRKGAKFLLTAIFTAACALFFSAQFKWLLIPSVALLATILWGIPWIYRQDISVLAKPLVSLVVFVAAPTVTGLAAIFLVPRPLIERVEPGEVFPGEEVAIHGQNFNADVKEDNVVSIGGLDASVKEITLGRPMIIRAVLPKGVPAGLATVKVTRRWLRWAEGQVRVLGKPVVEEVRPAKGFRRQGGFPGTRVEIIGQNFDVRPDKRRNNRVTFGTVEAQVERADETGGRRYLVTTVPELVQEGREVELVVETLEGRASSQFYVYGQPRIKSVDPGRGFRQAERFQGTPVAIIGSNFDDVAKENNVVSFGGVRAVVLEASFDKLEVRVPPAAADGKIVVTTPAGVASSAEPFTVIGAPRIDSFEPLRRAPGQAVVIAGANFDGRNIANNRVTINGVEALVTGAAREGTRLELRVPRGATDGKIRVETPAGTATSPYDFQVLPVVTRFEPPGGPPGTRGVVYGYGFQRGSTVKIGELPAAEVGPVQGAGTTEQAISFRVPAGVLTGKITVVVDAHRQAASAEVFEVHRKIGEIGFRLFPPRSAERERDGSKKRYQTDCAGNRVRVTDLKSRAEMSISVGRCPTDIALDSSQGYVTNFESGTVSVIDLQTDQVVKDIPVQGSNPVRIAVLHGWIHILRQGPAAGGRTTAVVQSISSADPFRSVENAVGSEARAFRVDRKAGWVYVLAAGPGGTGGQLTGILAEAPSKVFTIVVGSDPRGLAVGAPKAYVTNFGSDTIAVVDLQSKQVVRVINLKAGARPFGIAIRPTKPDVFVTASGLNSVLVVDARDDALVKEIPVGKTPLGVVFAPTGCIAVVVNSGERTVSVIEPDAYRTRGDAIFVGGDRISDVRILDDRVFVRDEREEHEVAVTC